MTQTKVTQGQAMLPILDTLAKHRAAGPQAIPFIVEETLKSMGLGVDCMGEKQGRPHVFIPFNNAGMELRFRQCIRSVGRNWEITEAGLEAVKTRTLPPKIEGWAAVKNPRKPKGDAPPAVKPANGAKTSAAKASTKTTGPKAVAKTKTGGAQKAGEASAPPGGSDSDPDPGSWTPEDQETLNEAGTGSFQDPQEIADRLRADGTKIRTLTVVVSNVPADAWVKDEAIRALVADNTPCYGTFSPSHSACVSCPLRESCGSALAVGLSGLAEALLREAKRTSAVPVTSVSDASVHAARGLSPTGMRTGPTFVRSMVTQYEGAICARSGATISKDTLAFFIPGEGIVREASITPEERTQAGANDATAHSTQVSAQGFVSNARTPS